MWVEYGIDHLQSQVATALTIGAFDGVHLGHQALIREMVAGAHAAAAHAVVLTFDPLPRQVLGRNTAGLISSLDERLELFEALQLDGTIVLPFTREFAGTRARDFVAKLVERLHPTQWWTGPDFRLGRGQEGDIAFLKAQAAQWGFRVHSLDEPVLWQWKPVRSSRIRTALSEGSLEEANGCLGRPYALAGAVGHGDQRGRSLGFPTANLIVPAGKLLPANGVYLCRALLKRGAFDALVNVGTRPTFDLERASVEAYLLDFSGDLYGESMRLDFLHRLRPELRFPSAEALIEQVRQDEINGRAWLIARRESGSAARESR